MRNKRRSRCFFFGGGAVCGRPPPPNSADRASALVFFALPGFFFAAICRLCHSSCGRVCVILAPGRAARFVCGAFTFAPGVGRGGDAPDAWGGREASDPASPAAVARMPLTLRFNVAARALCCQRCGSTGVGLPGVSTARRRRRPKIWQGGAQKAQGQETAERIVCRGAGQTVCCWRTQLDHFVMTRACQIATACRFVVLSVARIDRRSCRAREARERGRARGKDFGAAWAWAAELGASERNRQGLPDKLEYL